MRTHLERLHTFTLATFFELFSEHDFFARLVPALVKLEFAALLRFFDRPAGENFGEFGDIFLRVAAINAQRVEFHDLSRIVLVESAGTLGLLLRCLLWSWSWRIVKNHSKRPTPQPSVSEKSSTIFRLIRVRSNALPVVEIEKHRRTLSGCNQQVFEFTQSTWTNHITLIGSEHVTIGAFIDEDVEVIHPEIGHHFVELALTVDGAKQLGLRELSLNHELRIYHRQQRFFLLRGESIHELRALLLVQRLGDGAHVIGAHFHQVLKALIGRFADQRVGAQRCIHLIFESRTSATPFAQVVGSLSGNILPIVLIVGCVLLRLLLLLLTINGSLIDRFLLRIARDRSASILHHFDDLRRREVLHQFVGAHLQCAERSYPRFER